MKYTTTFVCGAALLLGGITEAHAQDGSPGPTAGVEGEGVEGEGVEGEGVEGEGAASDGAADDEGAVGDEGATGDEEVRPPQFTLVDAHSYTHRNWYQFWRFPWQPRDWTTPVDYYRGATYLRYEIHALLEPAMLQFCYFQDRHVSEKHACGPQWTFTAPGVYYRRVVNRELWQRHVIDWTRELLDFMLIDNTSEGAARAQVTVDIIVVAENERLAVPDHWQCPRDWNCIGGIPPTTPNPPAPDPEQPDPEQPDPEQPDPEETDPEEPDPEQPGEVPPDDEADTADDEVEDDEEAPETPAEPDETGQVPDRDSGGPGDGDQPPEVDELDLNGPPRGEGSTADGTVGCAFTQGAAFSAGGLGLVAPLALLAWRRRRPRRR